MLKDNITNSYLNTYIKSFDDIQDATFEDKSNTY